MAERRYSVVLYAALLTAAVATFGVWRAIRTTRENARVATKDVVVATQDLAQGASITSDVVTTKKWPVATVPADAYDSPTPILGRVVNVPVFTGEAILPGRLAPVGVAAGLEVKVPTGKRAMAVRINDVAGISGLIQPNSKVDVLVTLNPMRTNERPVAKLFLENVRVLSVGPVVQRDAEGKPIASATTAALEVTPAEAERLALAANEGNVQLVLRGYGDAASIATPGAQVADVLSMTQYGPGTVLQAGQAVSAGEVALRRPVTRRVTRKPVAKPVVVKPVVPESVTVTIWRGGTQTQQKFPNPATTRKP